MKITTKIEGLKELDKALGNLKEEYRGKSLYNALNFASNPMVSQIRKTVPQTTAPYKRYMSHGQGESTYTKTKNGKLRRGKSKRAKPGEGKFVMQEPALLRKNIRRVRLNKQNQNRHRAAVGIGVNVSGKTGYSAFYWHMVEYGTRYHRAQPFIRPAFDQNQGRAVERFKSQLAKNIKKHTG